MLWCLINIQINSLLVILYKSIFYNKMTKQNRIDGELSTHPVCLLTIIHSRRQTRYSFVSKLMACSILVWFTSPHLENKASRHKTQ